MIVIYLKPVPFVIFITNLYRRKIFTFYSAQRRNSGKKRRQLICMREDRMTSVDHWTLILIFCVDVHMLLDPSPHVHMRPPDPLPPPCGRHKWMALTELAIRLRENKKVFEVAYVFNYIYCENVNLGLLDLHFKCDRKRAVPLFWNKAFSLALASNSFCCNYANPVKQMHKSSSCLW